LLRLSSALGQVAATECWHLVAAQHMFASRTEYHNMGTCRAVGLCQLVSLHVGVGYVQWD
jgi:hypothetical protein